MRPIPPRFRGHAGGSHPPHRSHAHAHELREFAGGDVTLEAIDKAVTVIETDGLVPNGIASSAAVGGALRTAYRSVAALPGEAPTNQVYGVPVAVTSPWDSTKGDALVGDWSHLVIGVREDITFDLSTDGVLANPAGDIQVSAFHDDMTLVRVVFRAGCVLAKPLQADGSGQTKAFALADWTAQTLDRWVEPAARPRPGPWRRGE